MKHQMNLPLNLYKNKIKSLMYCYELDMVVVQYIPETFSFFYTCPDLYKKKGGGIKYHCECCKYIFVIHILK